MTADGAKGQPQFGQSDAATLSAYLSSVGNYAAKVGNRIVGTSSQRSTFSTSYGFAPWTGLAYGETDTLNEYVYTGSGWVGVKTDSSVVAFATGDFTPNGGGYQATRAVTFRSPTRFTSAPTIATGVFTGAAQDQHAGVVNVTTSGFTLYYWRVNLTATSIGWTAVPVDS